MPERTRGFPFQPHEQRMPMPPERVAHRRAELWIRESFAREIPIEPVQIAPECRVELTGARNRPAGRILMLPVAIPAGISNQDRNLETELRVEDLIGADGAERF